jgi:hypothetical protein
MPTAKEILDYRRALRTAGYDPIPVKGKRPPIEAWQTLVGVTDEQMAGWAIQFPHAPGTGIGCERTPALHLVAR